MRIQQRRKQAKNKHMVSKFETFRRFIYQLSPLLQKLPEKEWYPKDALFVRETKKVLKRKNIKLPAGLSLITAKYIEPKIKRKKVDVKWEIDPPPWF